MSRRSLPPLALPATVISLAPIVRFVMVVVVVFVGLSYRFYLARYHTEIGIEGMASWWVYVIHNAERLAEGKDLLTLYPPGQSWAAFLVSQVFLLDPAVLRVCFGLVDGLAIVFVYLLASELSGWGGGLVAAALYALWPEGASASVNILHDHSPQPLFLFAGFWLLAVWTRKRGWSLLALAGFFLGLPPLFRTDAVMVAPLAAIGLAAALLLNGSPLASVASRVLVLLTAALLPSLPYDLHLYRQTGEVAHIAAGEAGGTAFHRYGRTTGVAGTRHHDSEVALVTGVGQPFGPGWWARDRAKSVGSFGRSLFLVDPGRYARTVLGDSWRYIVTPAGYRLWLEPELAGLRDLPVAVPLRSPEWPLAVVISWSRIQYLLVSRVFLLVMTVAGLAIAVWRSGLAVLPLGVAFVGWILLLLLTMPESRYFVMPLCLSLIVCSYALAGLPTLMRRVVRSSGWKPE